ncbi:MAG: nucleoside triphosphate pyrophosphohydrolase [Chloroflexi bacterium]|nr:nucleoside triphosphate pyrophosphohydrolase [Chloroflexota bacterium]
MTSPPAPTPTRSFDDLVGVVETLLGTDGCPWDREQTHSSLRRYLLEESYELIEAIDADDAQGMAEELGDLLVHVLFHSEMARRQGEFELGDVVLSAASKMIGRHPHVFEEGVNAATAEEVLGHWEDLKRKEKPGKKRLVADAVPKAMPALAYAAEIQNRASKAGLEWHEEGSGTALDSALSEILSGTPEEAKEQIAGEALFNLVTEMKAVGVDPETALRSHALAFRTRLERTEIAAGETSIADLPPGDLHELWKSAAAPGNSG